MARHLITDRMCAQAKPGEPRLHDGDGLALFTTKRAVKSWQLRWDNNRQTATLGRYPTMSLAQAREAAEKAFGVPTRFPPGKGLRVPPWLRSEIVRAEIIDNPVYPVEGATEVLEPFFD